ncbi:cytochrome P450 3A9 [Ixodes scapularis]|uniref:cytochrome P450 3A9 n=1 Tax=Ixodes scapularis TaxID=6945 RepID=UPI001A9FDCBE|nr:cytochrome P450 3A9 [Ixodes scapularis]
MLFFGFVDWIILVVTAIALLYLYASRHRNYWKDQNVVHEKYSLVLGPISRFFFKPFHMMNHERYIKYGRLFGVFEGSQPVLVVADPELVKLVLVKDFTSLPDRRPIPFVQPLLEEMMAFVTLKKWRKLRPSASPAFASGKLRKMYPRINDSIGATVTFLKEAAEEDTEVDIRTLFSNYALDAIARCAFGTKMESHLKEVDDFAAKNKSFFAAPQALSGVISLLLPSLAKLLRLDALKSDRLPYFMALSESIIRERKHQENRQEDFLQLMMDVQEETSSSGADSQTDDRLFNPESGSKAFSMGRRRALTKSEALAQCIMFFLAGRDTSATLLAHAIYMLALHPEAQAKLRKEADECFEKHGEELTMDVVAKLKYVRGVVSETLRMLPPATRLERLAAEDYVLGDTGIRVPKGCIIAIPIYSMHHDPEYFPDPFTFKPERFIGENIESIRPYTYLPFGAGPRNCIGDRFALEAIKIALLHVVRSVEFYRSQNTRVPLEFLYRLRLLQAKDVTVGIRKRPVQVAETGL